MIFGLVLVVLGGAWLWRLLSEVDEEKRIKKKKRVVFAGIIVAIGVLMLSVFAVYSVVFIAGFALAIFGGVWLLQLLREKDEEKRKEKKRSHRVAQIVLIFGGIITVSSFSPLPPVAAIGFAAIVGGGLWFLTLRLRAEDVIPAPIKKFNKFSPYIAGAGAFIVLLSFAPLLADLPEAPPVEVVAVTTPRPEATPTPMPTPEPEIEEYFEEDYLEIEPLAEPVSGFEFAQQNKLYSGVRIYWIADFDWEDFDLFELTADPFDPDAEAEHIWTILAFGNEGGLREGQILADGDGYEVWDTSSFFITPFNDVGVHVIRTGDPALLRAEREYRATPADNFRFAELEDIGRVQIAEQGGVRLYSYNLFNDIDKPLESGKW